MKRVLPVLLVVVCAAFVSAQSDTIFTRNGRKIICKISEISEHAITYGLDGYISPVIRIEMRKVQSYILANGYSVTVYKREISPDISHTDILDRRRVLKFHPLSFTNCQLSAAYEQVIKPGMNGELEIGYVNRNFNSEPVYGHPPGSFYSGGYIKPGIKFLLGPSFRLPGMSLAHPLNGSYLKLDMAFSYVQLDGISAPIFGFDQFTDPVLLRIVNTSVNVYSYGFFLNIGKQIIFAKTFVVDIYAGFGYSMLGYAYTNGEYNALLKANLPFFENVGSQVHNFHGFLRMREVGLSGTAGLRLGYILPAPKSGKNNALIEK